MIQSVLVPVDGSELSGKLLHATRALLKGRSGALARLLHVLPPASSGRGQAELELATMVSWLEEGGVAATSEVVHGEPADAILRRTAEEHPDLLVMATHGRRGLQRALRGSVAERVLRHGDAPLLLCNPQGLRMTANEAGFRRILVPLDGGPLSGEILPLVEEFANAFGSEVVLLRVGDPLGDVHGAEALRLSWLLESSLDPFARSLESAGVLSRVTAPLASEPKPSHVPVGAPRPDGDAAPSEALPIHPFGIRTQVAHGHPVDEILRAVERLRVDLVAMSSHGRDGLSRWRFGSVAESVLRDAPCPLLIRRARAG